MQDRPKHQRVAFIVSIVLLVVVGMLAFLFLADTDGRNFLSQDQETQPVDNEQPVASTDANPKDEIKQTAAPDISVGDGAAGQAPISSHSGSVAGMHSPLTVDPKPSRSSGAETRSHLQQTAQIGTQLVNNTIARTLEPSIPGPNQLEKLLKNLLHR